MKDVLETIAPKEKRYPALPKDDDLYRDQGWKKNIEIVLF